MKYSYSETDLKRYRKIEERYFKWMEDHWYKGAKAKFEWNEENVRRILALNDAIIQKENSLYRLLSNVKADIENLLASGKAYYKFYDIDAFLSYEAEDYAMPTGNDEMMTDISNSAWVYILQQINRYGQLKKNLTVAQITIGM